MLSLHELRSLMGIHESPCVSICLPTHRQHPGTEQDPIRFKNLVRQAETLLRRAYSGRDVDRFLEPIEKLSERRFWQHSSDGLVLYRSASVMTYFRLPFPVRELVVVADTFHTKPLVRALHGNRRFYILAVSKNSAKLYEGSAGSLVEVEIEELPSGLQAVLGPEPRERGLGVRSGGRTERGSVYFGAGDATRRDSEDLLRYFRTIDRALWDLLRDEWVPLVLAGVAQYHPLFRQVSRYPYLLDAGVEGNVEHEDLEEILLKAWPLVASHFEAKIADRLAEWGDARRAGRASDDLEAIAHAAAHGRIRCLLAAEGCEIWGRVHPETGAIAIHEAQADTRDADLLDELSEMTLLRGGETIVLPAGRMPSASLVAAIFRY